MRATTSDSEPTAFPRARTLFRVSGVPVRADASSFLLAGLLWWFLDAALGRGLPELGVGIRLAASAVGTLLFLASVLAHEAAHAITSVERGVRVRAVTLFLLGGVTESVREASRPADEFVIVGAGPYTSLVLGCAFALVAAATEAAPAVAFIAGYLGWTNIALAVFNIVPGYPLDGGRLLRAVLWRVSGDRHRSTRWAAHVGQAFAVVLITIGAWALATAGGFAGVWEIGLGFFLLRGATAAVIAARRREQLARTPVRDIMTLVPVPLAPDLSVAAARERVQERPGVLWPVGAPVVGVVTADLLAAAPDEARVGTVALAPDGRLLDADATLDDALGAMADAPERMLVVTANDRAVGLLVPRLLPEDVQ